MKSIALLETRFAQIQAQIEAHEESREEPGITDRRYFSLSDKIENLEIKQGKVQDEIDELRIKHNEPYDCAPEEQQMMLETQYQHIHIK